MKLRDALDHVQQLRDDEVIFAQKPWTAGSEAEIGELTIDFRVPVAMTDRGLDYFLEVSVAKEAIEVFGGREVTADQKRALLIFYAEHDAFPDWVFP